MPLVHPAAPRHPEAHGVGLSFAHVNRLDLLAEHYPDQLEYVEDVLIEWRSQSTRPMFTLEPGHTADDKATRDNLIALKAATTCLTQVPTLFGSHVDLGEDELENVDNLITELCALHPARANTGDGCRDGSTTTPPSTPAVDCDPNSLEKASVVRSSRRGSPSVEFASPRSRSE